MLEQFLETGTFFEILNILWKNRTTTFHYLKKQEENLQPRTFFAILEQVLKFRTFFEKLRKIWTKRLQTFLEIYEQYFKIPKYRRHFLNLWRKIECTSIFWIFQRCFEYRNFFKKKKKKPEKEKGTEKKWNKEMKKRFKR